MIFVKIIIIKILLKPRQHNNEMKKKYIETYKKYIDIYKLENIYSYKSNMVIETLLSVITYIEKSKK